MCEDVTKDDINDFCVLILGNILILLGKFSKESGYLF